MPGPASEMNAVDYRLVRWYIGQVKALVETE